jgi:hypothetical protein
MADQHHETAPAVGNNIADDIPDILESLKFHWDCIQTITGGSSQTSTAKLVVGNHGQYQRANISWKDGDEIYLNGGMYHLGGTTDQMCYWNSQLTFALGSGGSNANSDDLNASDWHYIYLDDSAIATAADNLITNAQILNSTEEPAYNHTKKGWYGPGTATTQTTDRCIFALRTDTDSTALEFFHSADLVVFGDDILSNISSENISASFGTDICTLTAPSFCTKVQASIKWDYVSAGSALYYQPEGASGSSGILVSRVEAGATTAVTVMPVITDSSQKIDLYESTGSNNTATISTTGWYFPEGM